MSNSNYYGIWFHIKANMKEQEKYKRLLAFMKNIKPIIGENYYLNEISLTMICYVKDFDLLSKLVEIANQYDIIIYKIQKSESWYDTYVNKENK